MRSAFREAAWGRSDPRAVLVGVNGSAWRVTRRVTVGRNSMVQFAVVSTHLSKMNADVAVSSNESSGDWWMCRRIPTSSAARATTSGSSTSSASVRAFFVGGI